MLALRVFVVGMITSFAWPVIIAGHAQATEEQHDAGLVSMYALIAHPAEFDGKRIAIVGVLAPLERAAALYPNRDSFEYGWKREAVYLQLSEAQFAKAEQLSERFVGIAGTFTFAGDDARNSYFGTLSNIDTLYGFGKRSDRVLKD